MFAEYLFAETSPRGSPEQWNIESGRLDSAQAVLGQHKAEQTSGRAVDQDDGNRLIEPRRAGERDAAGRLAFEVLGQLEVSRVAVEEPHLAVTGEESGDPVGQQMELGDIFALIVFDKHSDENDVA